MEESRYRFPQSLSLKRPGPPTMWPLVMFVLLALAGIAVSIAMWNGWGSAILISIAAWFLVVTWGFTVLMRDVQYAEVRVLEHGEQLQFVPSRSVERVDTIVAMSLLIPWALVIASLVAPGSTNTMGGVWTPVLVIAVPAILGYYGWQLKRPRGLTLTPAGISGVRRGPAVSLTWDQVGSVSVSDLPGRGKLVITTGAGVTVGIDSTRFGSDAHAVAHVIEHFLSHKRERANLTTGAAVLERFGATRFGVTRSGSA